MKNSRRNKKDRGVALISVLLALLLLIVLAFGLMFMSDIDTAINSNYRSEQQAFFAAKAGIEEVRDRMRRTATNSLDVKNSSMLPTTTASDTGGVLYVINQGDPASTPVQPWTAGTNKYKDDELCHDGYVFTFANSSTPPPDVPCPDPPTAPSAWYTQPSSTAPSPGWNTSTLPFNGTAAALSYKWVRITWKQNNSIQGSPTGTNYYTVDGTPPSPPSSTTTNLVCWDGKKEMLLQSPATVCEAMSPVMRPVYLATALAVANGSRRMVQAELAKTIVPTVPAALALDGPNPVFNSYSSNNSQIIGNDANSTPCLPAGNKPAIGVYDDNAKNYVISQLFKPTNYTGTPPGNIPNPPPSVVNIGPTGVAPNAYGSSGNLNQLAKVSALLDLVNTVTQSADNVVPSNVIPAAGLGTPTNPLITVVQGDFSMSGHNVVVGAGILLVEGTLSVSGSPEFDGLVLVIGKGIYYGDGDAVVGGQTLVANITSGVSGDIPGPPLVNLSGGGGAGGTYYDSCKANLGNDRIPYRVLATREIQY